MKIQLFLLMILAASAHAQAEQNPFLPPQMRQVTVTSEGGYPSSPSGVPGVSRAGSPIVDPVAQRKMNDLAGARMVAIIDRQEVWYKPEQGLYVRYPADGTSISTLEAPKPSDDIQQIKQAIAPQAGKPTTKKDAKGKSW
ncbi:hypothetical protein RBE51_19210 [Pseudomonas taiwanensis]|uniref:hypothetical protein n=1 Tax=Pseudomonas taiwanensis TaxID=470150 RepID=UPI0028DDABCF|nr:hypothetical protein [Pseudomonas taiwanensis]MDT8924920.1 hypothetical protein [Pseudomonas taiwanensis]